MLASREAFLIIGLEKNTVGSQQLSEWTEINGYLPSGLSLGPNIVVHDNIQLSLDIHTKSEDPCSATIPGIEQ